MAAESSGNPTPQTQEAAGRLSATDRRRVSGAAIRAFVNISDLWRMTDQERLVALGLPSKSTYHNWVRASRAGEDLTLPLDALLRISIIIGIHQALANLYQTPREAVDWLCGPHKSAVFGGRPPIDLITSGTQDGLLAVKRFLNAAETGFHMAPNEADRDFVPYRDEDIIFR